jgi:SAM-dependent methyltransferase
MKIQHYEKYLKSNFDIDIEKQEGNNIVSGKLVNKTDQTEAPIIDSIPRFVKEEDNYSKNFGLQWNIYKTTQLDSHSGLTITHDRVWNVSGWNKEKMKGKTVLEVGSGAGRFTEILLDAGMNVVSFDLSAAVDANYANNNDKGDLFLMQASIYEIPLEDNQFDYILFYGVLQHTPDPDKSLRCLYHKLKPGGQLTFDNYIKIPVSKWWPHAKYTWRPYTRKMKPQRLLGLIKFYMPIWFPIDTFLGKYKWPLNLGQRIRYRIPIPIWNYYQFNLSYKARLQWAIMDTFDGMGAYYDFPVTLDELDDMVDRTMGPSEKKVFYGGNGVAANIIK